MTKTQPVKTDNSRAIEAFFGSEALFAASLTEVIVATPPLFMVGAFHYTRISFLYSPTSRVKDTSATFHQISSKDVEARSVTNRRTHPCGEGVGRLCELCRSEGLYIGDGDK
jgi:hypothetical protein